VFLFGYVFRRRDTVQLGVALLLHFARHERADQRRDGSRRGGGILRNGHGRLGPGKHFV
jgi:hypothetical protein|tara:strand:- start:100 stop:276 length:177 start_codon:yes stop_codon:yes gene_type:complete